MFTWHLWTGPCFVRALPNSVPDCTAIRPRLPSHTTAERLECAGIPNLFKCRNRSRHKETRRARHTSIEGIQATRIGEHPLSERDQYSQRLHLAHQHQPPRERTASHIEKSKHVALSMRASVCCAWLRSSTEQTSRIACAGVTDTAR